MDTTADNEVDDSQVIIKADIDFDSLICDRHSGKIIYYDPIKNIIYDKNYDIVGEVDVNDGEFVFYTPEFKTGEPLDEPEPDPETDEYDYERIGLSDMDDSDTEDLTDDE
jgi:hypothetical protein